MTFFQIPRFLVCLALGSVLALLTPGSAAAQDEVLGQDETAGAETAAAAPATPAARPKPCIAPQYRHFDFWLGEWTVTNVQTGNSAAVNKISSIHGGCVVFEDYVSGAYTGTSLNFWDPVRERWTQTWIDNQGQPLRISGGLVDGSMVMSSEPTADGTIHRITWTPREDGTVRQHWESSKDGGDSWTTLFDGIYSKKR